MRSAITGRVIVLTNAAADVGKSKRMTVMTGMPETTEVTRMVEVTVVTVVTRMVEVTVVTVVTRMAVMTVTNAGDNSPADNRGRGKCPALSFDSNRFYLSLIHIQADSGRYKR